MARVLRRYRPIDLSDNPLEWFSILVVAQKWGTTAPAIFTMVSNVWISVMNTAPLDDVKTAVFFDDAKGVDFGITQSGGKLNFPQSSYAKLQTYLESRTTENENKVQTAATSIWPRGGRRGLKGSLIAIIIEKKKATDPHGELIALDGEIPIVCVTKGAAFAERVIARAMGQMLADLADEFERDGADWASPPPNHQTASHNVVYTTNAILDAIKFGAIADVTVAIPELKDRWGVSNADIKGLTRNTSSTANTTPGTAKGGFQLVEGGGGYRQNAVRADFDCLMRRIPGEDQIHQTQVDFCAACTYVMERIITGRRNLQDRRFARLSTQQILYDQVPLSGVTLETYPPNFDDVINLAQESTNASPKWTLTLDATKNGGLEIRDLKLKNRPDDPFTAAENVLSKLRFTGLAAVFADREFPLDPKDAVERSLDIFWNGGRASHYLYAARLKLIFDIPDRCRVEVLLSLVLCDQANDFDPGGAVYACKFYPQIGMRFLQLPKKKRKKKKKNEKEKSDLDVRELKGTIELVANNLIPTSLASSLHHDLHHFALGRQSASFFTDTNSTDDPADNEYTFDDADLANFTVTAADFLGIANDPGLTIQNGYYKSGRLLAGIYEVTVFAPRTFAGATARYYHLNRGLPGLPYWSWLFDYASPDLPNSKKIIAVHAATDVGRNMIRQKQFQWPQIPDVPSLNNLLMLVRKMPRQGAFDSIHIAADHNHDPRATGQWAIVSAPFCAETCFHFHWRWGTIALDVIKRPDDRANFWGWGDGLLDRGAHTSVGTPLVPPNQRVTIEVTRKPDDTECTLKYSVQALKPGLGEMQVFCEQGMGLAFNYFGLDYRDVARLAAGVAAISGLDLDDTISSLSSSLSSDRAKHDRQLRTLFHKIYPRLRWYDYAFDHGPDAGYVQQVPRVHDDDYNKQVLQDMEDL